MGIRVSSISRLLCIMLQWTCVYNLFWDLYINSFGYLSRLEFLDPMVIVLLTIRRFPIHLSIATKPFPSARYRKDEVSLHKYFWSWYIYTCYIYMANLMCVKWFVLIFIPENISDFEQFSMCLSTCFLWKHVYLSPLTIFNWAQEL